MKLNFPKHFYRRVVGFVDRLGAYKERADKYMRAFRQFIRNSGIILDVGCGPGTFSKIFASEHTVIALDIQKQPLKKIKNRKIHPLCADAHKLPLRKNAIDHVLSLTNRTSPKPRKAYCRNL